MNRRVYKTAQGVQVDIDQMRLLNEKVVAVGNMKVNARGDQVNPDGTIKTSRNEIMKNTYRTNAVVAGKGKTPSTPNTTKVVGTDKSATKPASTVTISKPAPNAVGSSSAVETTPAIMRGSLATAIAGGDAAASFEDSTGLLETSTNTRSIKRI